MEGKYNMLLEDIMDTQLEEETNKQIPELLTVENVKIILHLMSKLKDKQQVKTIVSLVVTLLSQLVEKDLSPIMPSGVEEIKKGVYTLYIDDDYKLISEEEASMVYLVSRKKPDIIKEVFDVNEIWSTHLRLFVAALKMDKLNDYLRD